MILAVKLAAGRHVPHWETMKLLGKKPLLNDDDHHALADLQSRLAVVRDACEDVAVRLHTGFYLFGRPGTGKTYTVRRTLADNEFTHHYQDGHLTPIGLFELLAEQHDRIIVLDDVAELLKNPIAQQILLAALGRQPGNPIPESLSIGGRGEYIRAVLGRVDPHLQPGTPHGPVAGSPEKPDQLPVLQPHRRRNRCPDAGHCSTRLAFGQPEDHPRRRHGDSEFLIHESQHRAYRLDLRLLVDKAFRDHLQHRNGQAETHWKDLIRATLDEQLISLHYTQAAPKTRQATKEAEHAIIRGILTEHSDLVDRVDAWMSLTGKSERAYYRRAAEIGP